jgi:hypothetical protein
MSITIAVHRPTIADLDQDLQSLKQRENERGHRGERHVADPGAGLY